MYVTPAFPKLVYVLENKPIQSLKLNYNEDEVRITMTYGLTEYDLSSSFEDNVKDADEKLYLGKQSGRDKIVY